MDTAQVITHITIMDLTHPVIMAMDMDLIPMVTTTMATITNTIIIITIVTIMVTLTMAVLTAIPVIIGMRTKVTGM